MLWICRFWRTPHRCQAANRSLRRYKPREVEVALVTARQDWSGVKMSTNVPTPLTVPVVAVARLVKGNPYLSKAGSRRRACIHYWPPSIPTGSGRRRDRRRRGSDPGRYLQPRRSHWHCTDRGLFRCVNPGLVDAFTPENGGTVRRSVS